METGTNFIKDGKTYHMPSKRTQSIMAYKSGLQFSGKPIDFKLSSCEQAGLFDDEDKHIKFSAIIVKPAAIAFYATAVHNAANAVNEIVFGTAVLIRKKHIFL